MLKHSKELLYNENKFLETMIEERTRELITTQNVTMQSLALWLNLWLKPGTMKQAATYRGPSIM